MQGHRCLGALLFKGDRILTGTASLRQNFTLAHKPGILQKWQRDKEPFCKFCHFAVLPADLLGTIGHEHSLDNVYKQSWLAGFCEKTQTTNVMFFIKYNQEEILNL